MGSRINGIKFRRRLAAAGLFALALSAPWPARAEMPPRLAAKADPDESLWRAADPSKPDDLRAYLATFPNGRHANEARATLGEAPPVVVTKPVPEEDVVTGAPDVLDAATFQIAGRTVPIFGLEAPPGVDLSGIREFIKGDGGRVTCTPEPLQSNRYNCFTPKKTNVALSILINGLARATKNAGESYHQNEKDARINHRGIWQ